METSNIKQAESLVPEHERYAGGMGGNPHRDPPENKARVRVRVQKAPWGPKLATLPGGYLIDSHEPCDVVMYRDELDALLATGQQLADAEEPARQETCRQRFVNALCKREGTLHMRLSGIGPEYEHYTVIQIRELYERIKRAPNEFPESIVKAVKVAEDTTPLSIHSFRHRMTIDGEAAHEPGPFVMLEAVEDLPPPKSPVRQQHEQGALEQQPVIAAAVGRAVAEGIATALAPLLAQLNGNGSKRKEG